jgi:hypothetical protein
MDTNTLNVIERSLTLLLAQTPTHASDTKHEDESYEIAQAVAILKQNCDALLDQALPSSKDLSNIEGKRMSENIDSTLERFRGEQPYSSLSNDNKMIVLKKVTRGYKNDYDYLYGLQLDTLWGEYKRRTYDTLVSTLQSEYIQLSNKRH